MVAEDDEMSKDKEIDKLMALISLSFKKIYKPANNNLRTSSNNSRANQDNSPRINISARYDNQRLGNVDGARETVDEHNVIIDSLDMSYDREQLNQDDDDDLANERELLASLIEKLKCEIDDSKNHNGKIKQETISTLSQAKEAQIKLYKNHEDKELDKVIALENKVK
nr:hypothetical protein [Tanacetum cinerariifolium]